MTTFRTRNKYLVLGLMGALLLIVALFGEYDAVLSLLSPADPLGISPAFPVSRSMLVMAACGLGAVLLAVSSLAFIRWEIALRRRTEQRMARLFVAAEQTGDLITIFDTRGRIEYVNRAVEQQTGYRRNELVGRHRTPWLPWYPDERSLRVIRDTVLQGTTYRSAVTCRRKNGEAFVLQERVEPFQDRKGAITRLISTARDITRERALEERIDFLDSHEPLTGVPNRRQLVRLLEQQMAHAREKGETLSVLIMDIDRFKYLNDIFGYEIGDRVLMRTAELLRLCAGKQDVIARLGSDEFAVVHRNAPQDPDAGALAEALKRSVSANMVVGDHEIVVTVTMGIAVFPQHGGDAETLLKNADMALLKAKAQGRNTVQLYAPDVGARMSDLYFLEKRLFGALKNDEYFVRYQPYCELSTKRVAGAEALVSWKNGDLGMVAPTRFIPTLEDTGLIVDVGKWVLRAACSQLQEWGRNGRAVTVSVNLSLIQFRHKYLLDMVSEALRDFRIDPRFLCLEVTEGICIHDIDRAVSILKKLKDAGVSISVDDFGTGYSSLNYIRKLPVDNLKIDMSFIRDVARDPDSASIVTAITGLARSLSLKTIAEGVENEEQRNVLHLLRCDMGQGYYFSKAVSAGEFEKLLV